jgi:succinate dehydrogenase hydrophobic anchor subunit
MGGCRGQVVPEEGGGTRGGGAQVQRVHAGLDEKGWWTDLLSGVAMCVCLCVFVCFCVFLLNLHIGFVMIVSFCAVARAVLVQSATI